MLHLSLDNSSLVPSEEENGSEAKPDESPEPDEGQAVPEAYHSNKEAGDDLPQDVKFSNNYENYKLHIVNLQETEQPKGIPEERRTST